MKDKLLTEMVVMADRLAEELALRVGPEEKDRVALEHLRVWNAMRQSMGAPYTPADRPFGEAFGVPCHPSRSPLAANKHLH